MNIHKVLDTRFALLVVGLLAIVFGLLVYFANRFAPEALFPDLSGKFRQQPTVNPEIKNPQKFSDEQDFKDYLQQAQRQSTGYGSAMGWGVATDGREIMSQQAAPSAVPTSPGIAKNAETTVSVNRVSQTNVQVLAIDEPDIVKTDGQQIYFSQAQNYYWRGGGAPEPMPMTVTPGIAPPQYNQSGVKIIKALPVADMAVLGKIGQAGDLLLAGKILIVFNNQKIYGYDISDSANPKEKWSLSLDYNNLAAARLKDGQLYLVVKKNINQGHPCPFKPLTLSSGNFEVKCVDIYRPSVAIPADITFTAMEINPATGQVSQSLSFVANSQDSVVYASDQALYVTYSYNGDFVAFMSNFLKEKASDLVPATILAQLNKLASYDLSAEAKMTELETILSHYIDSLSQDEQLKIGNEMTNRMQGYAKEHQRDLEKTGITKINLANFQLEANGVVPGRPLNQFSLDEFQGNLRIALTVGGRWSPISSMVGSSNSSVNDVYVLGKDLKVLGSVLDLGVGERIYSARFLGNRGYVVTFKETDPFYVLDLSNPQNPQKKGELKIPGYSAYLHPLADNVILGVGKENSQVKLSLFDVKDPSNPKELSKYTLDEYWSDILNTHHAFLQDAKHQAFFLPGGKGGYVFLYQGNQLVLAKAISGIQVDRALYINDYLYILAQDKISVLNETNWEKVKELQF